MLVTDSATTAAGAAASGDHAPIHIPRATQEGKDKEESVKVGKEVEVTATGDDIQSLDASTVEDESRLLPSDVIGSDVGARDSEAQVAEVTAAQERTQEKSAIGDEESEASVKLETVKIARATEDKPKPVSESKTVITQSSINK